MRTPGRRPPAPRPFPATPHCAKCGTAIAPGETFCPTCADSQGQHPEYIMQLHPQRRPPYERPPAVNPGGEGDA